MMRLPWPTFGKAAAPDRSDAARTLAKAATEARAITHLTERQRFRAMARELCACTGQAVPTPLED